MLRTLVNLNGTITEPQDAKVSVFDRGFLFGDGVYETGKTEDRSPLYLDEHFLRFRHSAERLGISVPWTDSELKKELFATLRQFNEDGAYFRIILTRGIVDHVGLDVLPIGNPTRVIIVSELSKNLPRVRERGLKILTSTVIRNSVRAQDPNIKTSNYLNSLLALQDAKRRGADDAVMCDQDGNLTEGTTFSVFGVTPVGTLITPSLSVGILESITRRHVIACAKRLGMEVNEGIFPLKEFLSCREVFIASSIRDVLPIRSWDGNSFPVPGGETLKLYEALTKENATYVLSHDRF